MDELEKGLSIALKNRKRDDALRRFACELKAWDLMMPAVDPLVLDFGLGTFERIGLIEFWIANETTAGYCGKYLFVFAGQTCPRHRHEVKHETFCLLKGSLVVTYGRKTIRLAAGDTLAIPPGKFHSFTGREPSLLLEISMPCCIDDNYFADRRIPIGGNYRPSRHSDVSRSASGNR